MSLKRTPLYEAHRRAGARLIDFGGWEMPVQYEGILAEHRACREAAALFDVSHMGEFTVRGPGAQAFLQQALTNNVAKLDDGQCQYTLMLNDDAGIVDDLLVYRRGDEDWLLVVNAANIDTDWAWLSGLDRADAELENISERTGLIALQGPRSRDILAPLVDDSERLRNLRYYRFGEFTLGGRRTLVSRTGYTGGLGFEIMTAAGDTAEVWDRLLAAGAEHGLVPAGLGARDTLRLEAALCLHGHDISPNHHPLEAGLERFVDLEKGPFVGREALQRVREAGLERTLVGLTLTGRGVLREGCELRHGGETVGVTTSGTFAPSLDASIALAYVPPALAEPGTELQAVIRGREVPCRVTERPFFRPSRS